jgi:hypothetical protein
MDIYIYIYIYMLILSNVYRRYVLKMCMHFCLNINCNKQICTCVCVFVRDRISYSLPLLFQASQPSGTIILDKSELATITLEYSFQALPR